MKQWRSNLDEMQEQKLLRIEHNGFWFAFWGLLAAMLIQQVLTPSAMAFRTIAGEWIIFMVIALYVAVACARSGIWSRRLKMNAKTNLAASLIAGAVLIVFSFLVVWTNFRSWQGSLAAGVIAGVCGFLLCFAALQATARYTRRRIARLEAEPEEGEPEESEE